MSGDIRMRNVERLAATGDPSAKALLDRLKCRAVGHFLLIGRR